MATRWLSACLLLTLIHYSLTLNFKELKVPAQSDIISGVFMIPSGGEYRFNAATARTACQFLNVTIATKGQLHKALKQGLEKCKFGWIDEEIVVIPRITANDVCGKNKTGVVEWTVDRLKLFAAFCFSTSGHPTIEALTETMPAKMFTSPVTPHDSAVSETQVPKLSPNTSAVTPPTMSKPSRNFVSTSPPATEFLSYNSNTFSHPRSFKASSTGAPSSSSSSSSSSSMTPTTFLNPFSYLTSNTKIPSTSVHQLQSLFSSPPESISINSLDAPVATQTVSHTDPFIGPIPTAVIILVILLLLLAAAVAVWYNKKNEIHFPLSSRWKQKDDTETEIWRRTGSETNFQDQQGEEDEELISLDGSPMVLSANQEIKINFIEI